MKHVLNRLWIMMFGYDIFISYRREDSGNYAESLISALEQQGFTCFLDREETVGGVRLDAGLNRALRRSRMMVAILTQGVIQSQWIRHEIKSYLEKPNRLIPVNVDGFLDSPQSAATLFEKLRGLSWIDETGQSVRDGIAGPGVVSEVVKSYRWRRTRTYARLLLLTVVLALAVGGWSVTQYIAEEQRQANIAYADIGSNLDRLHELLKLMARLSGPEDFLPWFNPAIDYFRKPEVLRQFEKYNLTHARLPGPLLGYPNVSPPGDVRPVIKILDENASTVTNALEEIRKQKLALMDKNVPMLLGELVYSSFMRSISDAVAKQAHYLRLEDSNTQAFYFLGMPGLSEPEQFLSFLEKIDKLKSRLAELETSHE